MSQLVNRAMLVSLAISQWTARKQDKQATRDVAVQNGIGANIASVSKKLLPASVTLTHIQKLVGAIRNDYYAVSLPWAGGMQIIKSESYLKIANKFSDYKVQFDELVDQFMSEYAEEREDAKVLLGPMWNENDYPSVYQLRRKFRMEVNFYPVPDAHNWLVEGIDEGVDELRQSLERDVATRLTEASGKAWERIYKLVSETQQKLATPGMEFKSSLISNAQDLCALLPDLNLTNDPNLEKMRQALETSLCDQEYHTLRDDPLVRQKAAATMADIMAKMGAFYTPSN